MHWRLHNLMVGAWMVWRVRICRMVRRRRGYIVVQWILLRVAWLLRRRAGLWLLLLKLLWILWIVGRLVRLWRCAVEAGEGGRRCVSGELPGGVGDGRDAILRERRRGRHRRVGLLSFDLSSFGHDDRESLRIIRQRHWKG